MRARFLVHKQPAIFFFFCFLFFVFCFLVVVVVVVVLMWTVFNVFIEFFTILLLFFSREACGILAPPT